MCIIPCSLISTFFHFLLSQILCKHYCLILIIRNWVHWCILLVLSKMCFFSFMASSRTQIKSIYPWLYHKRYQDLYMYIHQMFANTIHVFSNVSLSRLNIQCSQFNLCSSFKRPCYYIYCVWFALSASTKYYTIIIKSMSWWPH